MSRWWRAYDEAVDDPKLILLPDRLHRAWFNLMCVASLHGGILPDIKTVAVKLRMAPVKAAAVITELVSAGLIDRRDDGKFEPHNWPQRQFQSDVSTDRVQRFRKRKRNVSSTVSETPPETEAETDTDPSLRSGEARKRATRLSADWKPTENDLEFARSNALTAREIDVEAEKFRNYWTAKGGKDAAKRDWPATWRNWILNAVERRPRPGPNDSAPRPGSKEDTRERTVNAIRQLTDYVDANADEQGGSGGTRETDAGLLRLAQPSRS